MDHNVHFQEYSRVLFFNALMEEARGILAKLREFN